MTNFDPPHLENGSSDFDETWNLELPPKDHPACKTTYRCLNVGGLGEHPVCHCKFLSLPFSFFLFWFLHLAHQWTDLYQNWHVVRFRPRMCLLGWWWWSSRWWPITFRGSVPQNPKFWGRDRHSKPNLQCKKFKSSYLQIYACIGLAYNLTGRCGPMIRLRGWSYMMM